MSTKKVLVTFATPDEGRPLLRCLAASNITTDVLFTGIGPQHARRTLLAHLDKQRPDWVISSGFAGAIAPGFAIGNIVYDISDSPGLESLLRPHGHPAAFCSTERILITVEEKKQLRADRGPDVVEMESGTIREICRDRKVPCAVVRAISDAAEDALPLDFNDCLNSLGQIRIQRVLAQCVTRPGILWGLMRLRRNSKRAADRLAEVLPALIAGIP